MKQIKGENIKLLSYILLKVGLTSKVQDALGDCFKVCGPRIFYSPVTVCLFFITSSGLFFKKDIFIFRTLKERCANSISFTRDIYQSRVI